MSFRTTGGFGFKTTEPLLENQVLNLMAKTTPAIANTIPSLFVSFTGVVSSTQSIFGSNAVNDLVNWAFTFQSSQIYPAKVQI